jgi:DNA-binding transcriptional MerR regulator
MAGVLRPAEVAARLKISAPYLRRLERQGKIPRARRDAEGNRVYTESDILAIRKLRSSAKGVQITPPLRRTLRGVLSGEEQ